MEQQIEIVNKIEQELSDIKKLGDDVYSRLTLEKQKLTSLCGVKGHMFDRYGGFDGHRNNYYYTCRTCFYTTSYKPDKWVEDYSH